MEFVRQLPGNQILKTPHAHAFERAQPGPNLARCRRFRAAGAACVHFAHSRTQRTLCTLCTLCTQCTLCTYLRPPADRQEISAQG